MDVQILRTLGETAGLAGLAVGMILLLYQAIVRKNIFPMLTRTDAFRLLRTIAVLSWSVAIFGILCWVLSTRSGRHNSSDPSAATTPPEPPVVAGTIVDQVSNLGIGRATIEINGRSSTSDDLGNFRIVLPAAADRVMVSVTHEGYFDAEQSVVPPTHDMVVQLRPR